ncbi:amidase signature domain-containing protein [Bisporella sp. PMI_857]|nr:amidase signature domain-containing protein [Bisporella sp. PMI_857]
MHLRLETLGCILSPFLVFFIMTRYRHLKRDAANLKLKITPDGELYLNSIGTLWFESLQPSVKIFSGPYIWHLGQIFKVWRLYSDTNGAFIQPVVQSWIEADRMLSNSAIKEIYDLKGVRDFLPLYDPPEESALAIRKFISYGAIIIGKTKTTQFVSGEGSMDWVDYQCSFNPRGDRYQDTSMSSVGSAAGLASYDWIDSSLGTDTFGSVLWPAAAQGIFGLRPTHSVLDNSGVPPLSEHLDTVGCFSRSVDMFLKIGNAWFNGTFQHKFELPQKLLVPIMFWKPYQTPYLASIVEYFIRDLGKVLDVQRIEYDIETEWASTSLPQSNTPLKDYLATTLATIQLYDCYHNNAKFRNDFHAKKGYQPYVNPMIRFKW